MDQGEVAGLVAGEQVKEATSREQPMDRKMHHMSLPAPILRRGFWLYVWKVGLPNGALVHYVGMTGDTGSGAAQSAMNRVSAHLGQNVRSNALRRYLKSKREIELEACGSLDFLPTDRSIRSCYRLIIPCNAPALLGLRKNFGNVWSGLGTTCLIRNRALQPNLILIGGTMFARHSKFRFPP